MSADFDDDEHRARIAHEHPVDVHSSPSSLSSGDHTYFHSHPRRGSKTGSSSSHLLARLISREEEVRDIKATLVVTTERLEAESSRANAAERRALDYFHRLRIATENRERAEQDSARLREELKLYKLQLDNAQKEIFRAQDIIDQVSNQRNEAEAEAARARTKARKLQEEKLIMHAREEGRRLGYRQGLSMGRRIGYDEEMNDDGDNVPERGESTTDEERMDPRPHPQLRSSESLRQQPTRSESAPPVRTFDATLAPPLPVRVYTPSHEHQPSPPRDPDGPETIHPIPIRPSPIIPARPISVPIDDGWIPRVDSRTSQIHMPSPHKLQQPIPASPSAPPIEVQDRRGTPHQEPTPVPPPVRSRDYAYQTSVPPPSIPRVPSLASRASTHLSQYDIVNKRPGSALRNEIYIGRPRSGSQPSRESTSRNEYLDSERRYSSRTEAENIADQWRADTDIVPGPPPRPYTPSASAPPHRVPHFYRPREVVTPTPLGDNDDPRSRTPVPTEPTAGQSHPPDDSHPARPRPLAEYHRKRVRQRQRPGSGGSGSIPNIIVESPSEPETTMSPSVTTAAQPELLSPEAANRPLPQEDTSHHTQPPPPSSRPHNRDHASASASASVYDVVPPRSGTPHSPWPAGFVPYPPGHTTSSSSGTKSGPEREHRRTYDRANLTPGPLLLSNRTPTPLPGALPEGAMGRAGSQGSSGGYGRARSQSASTPMGRYAGVYEAAPLPPGVTYPAPPERPQTSHRQYRSNRDRDRDRDWEWDRDRERDRARERHRDVGGWERERERARDYDRDRERRRDPGRDYERDRRKEQDPDDTGLDEELTRSPAPLQRPISLFDSDSA